MKKDNYWLIATIVSVIIGINTHWNTWAKVLTVFTSVVLLTQTVMNFTKLLKGSAADEQ